MPLSEDEKRILSEIEDHFYESDPELAREVSQTTIYTHAFRNLKWASLTFLIGVTLMILLLSVHFALAFIGFAVMLASVLWFENNARKLGRAGLQEMTDHYRGGTLGEAVGGAGMRFRQRFRRPDDRD